MPSLSEQRAATNRAASTKSVTARLERRALDENDGGTFDCRDEAAAMAACAGRVACALHRSLVYAHHLLDVPYSTALPAARIVRRGRGDRTAAAAATEDDTEGEALSLTLPAEVVSNIVAFLPLAELLPRGYLGRRYARSNPQGCWLASRTFLVCALTEACQRLALDGIVASYRRPVDPSKRDRLPREAAFNPLAHARAAFVAAWPAAWAPLQAVVCALLLEVMRPEPRNTAHHTMTAALPWTHPGTAFTAALRPFSLFRPLRRIASFALHISLRHGIG